MAKSPSVSASPFAMVKRDVMILLVLVLWMRTAAAPSRGTTHRPSSAANGPMAEDMLPQLPL
jgi:hypothetical protein